MDELELNIRQKLLMTYLGKPSNNYTYDINPTRIMKGLFFFTKEVPSSWIDKSELYEFSSHDFDRTPFTVPLEIGVCN